MNKLDRWQGYVPDEELEVYRKAGFGERIGFGTKTALLNIDTTWMFIDPAYDMCGRRMPEVEAALAQLTEAFRRAGLPIYYSRRGDRSPSAHRANLFDMDMKFADVEDLDYVLDHLKKA